MLINGHWYRINDRGEMHIGQYMGRQRGFECCVCGNGNNAHTFNIWHIDNGREDYETWGYGEEHLPTIVDDFGYSDDVLIDK